MEITGRLIADSRVNQVKGNRQVVNFCVAVNESYRQKDSNEVKRTSTLYNCSYWVNPTIAQYLIKGALVELFGHVSVNAWNNAEGEAKASLNFHVNNIKLHGGSKQGAGNKNSTVDEVIQVSNNNSDTDDLPF